MGEFIGQIICSIKAGLGIRERWCFRLGLIWTFFNIKDNWTVYRTYPSVVTQVGQNSTYILFVPCSSFETKERNGVKEVTFPKIHICLNSAHSADKLR